MEELIRRRNGGVSFTSMSGAPKLRSMNVTESDSRPILGPAGNKTRLTTMYRKQASNLPRGTEKTQSELKEEKKDLAMERETQPSSLPTSPVAVLRRQKLLLQANLSMDASCSSDASTDSFCSRASTGLFGRRSFTSKGRQGVPKPEKIVGDGAVIEATEIMQMKKRCAWVTPNTDSSYVIFHDEEWGVPVHDDKKLFELLVLSGALAELTWPEILNRRQIFREVFMNFDPVLISKMNKKKLISPGSIASSLLSEAKLRAVVENGQLIVKIIEEFGSFNEYCWSFVSHRPIVSRFRYPRQIPVKTPKADSISKDLVRRGFRGVGPTVIYSFMQTAGLTNDHVVGCFRFDECGEAANLKPRGCSESSSCGEERKEDIVLDIIAMNLESK
ncbi:uncharacterized protein LOC110029248 [Phalaenopsis equestris]|uniref:uncharacterized protein LOC110029248 n=1 Tax=Phalaenopsis equestris TaxID=78828 RepID=UPI0009E4BAC2|nr:uncharacterized protein LOC110029248 [Phalaenopsis equestris]